MKKNLVALLIVLLLPFIVKAQTMNITYQTLNESGSAPAYVVSATYPQIDFGPDALMGVRGIAQDINSQFTAKVQSIAKDFSSSLSVPAGMENDTSELTITSEAWVNNSKILSSEMTVFNNTVGMAHPMTTVTTMNFVDDGSGPLVIGSLFKPDSEYLNYISTVCIRELTAYAEKEGATNIKDMILSGAAADAKNFTEWTIKNDSLNIIFNPYQVAPYVFGIQRVAIPLSDLNPMIDPNGPVGYMMR